MEGVSLPECAAIAFVLATLAGVVIGAIAGFEFGCAASFVTGFGILMSLGKIN